MTTHSFRTPLRLGTRGSQLALYQANTVAALIQRHAGIVCEIVIIRTTGDRLSEASLSEAGGKRLFVKEIEDALLNGAIDLAVHSSKDMPVILPEGLDIGAVLPREDPRDAIVLPEGADRDLSLEDVVARLGREPRIGTSSVRRSAQLIRLFPGGSFLPIRGNLDTRLRKLDAGGYDAIVLAAAGLRRLEAGHRISASLPVDACVPSPGQGIIAIEIREADADLRALLAGIDDAPARIALQAERAVVAHLGGGCQMPLGAYAAVTDDAIAMTAVVLALDGSRAVRAEARGARQAAEAVGRAVADDLLSQGAAALLEDVARAQPDTEGQAQ